MPLASPLDAWPCSLPRISCACPAAHASLLQAVCRANQVSNSGWALSYGLSRQAWHVQAFQAMKEYAAHSRQLKQRLARAVARMQRGALAASFTSLRDHAAQQKRLKASAVTVVAILCGRTLAGCFRGWQHWASRRRSLRTQVQTIAALLQGACRMLSVCTHGICTLLALVSLDPLPAGVRWPPRPPCATQGAALQRTTRSRLLSVAMQEWHADAAFAAYSRRVLAGCVVRMRSQTVAAAFATWQYEVSHVRVLTPSQTPGC